MNKISSQPLTKVSKYDIVNIALFLGISSKEVFESMKKIHIINNTTYSNILRHNPEYAIERRITTELGYVLIRTLSINNVYYINEREFGNAGLYENAKIAYLILYVLSDINNIDEIIINYARLKSYHSSLDSYRRNFVIAEEQYRKLLFDHPIFTLTDYRPLFLYAKKMKIKLEKTDQNIIMNFKQIKVGNDVEGYVSYKNIEITFDLRFKLLRTRFYFNKFMYDTGWEMDLSMHPHIHSYVCYGNRADDFNAYLAHHNFPFLLDLIKETVNSYYPERPFINIKKLGSRIKAVEKALIGSKLGDCENDEKKSKEIFEFIRGKLTMCGCGSYQYLGHCTNPNCVHSLEYQEAHPPIQATNNPIVSTTPLTEEEIEGISELIVSDDMEDALEVSELPRRLNLICNICHRDLEISEETDAHIINGETVGQPAGYYCADRNCPAYNITVYNMQGAPILPNLPSNTTWQDLRSRHSVMNNNTSNNMEATETNG